MKKYYDSENVFLKLLYYCNVKKEVYFRRSDVTEYLINSSVFDIPNKQGFDGNLSYFGYDIKNDIDSNRILLLRGSKINEKCLQGQLKITKEKSNIVVDDEPDILDEIDKLIKNKTYEARAFSDKQNIIDKYGLIECSSRIYGNKKIYSKGNDFYLFPRVLSDCINNFLLYEIVNTDKLHVHNPYIIFPIYGDSGICSDERIISLEELGELDNDFCYFQYRDSDEMISEFEIQNRSNENILKLLNQRKYNLEGKESTKKVLNNTRLNTSALRSLALHRDNYKCAFCGINDENLLICSHIKPWKMNDGRLDIDNVLTLCVMHDALFDKGYLSLDKNGKIIYCSESILEDKGLLAFLNESNMGLNINITSSMQKYLSYHRNNIFKGNRNGST